MGGIVSARGGDGLKIFAAKRSIFELASKVAVCQWLASSMEHEMVVGCELVADRHHGL